MITAAYWSATHSSEIALPRPGIASHRDRVLRDKDSNLVAAPVVTGRRRPPSGLSIREHTMSCSETIGRGSVEGQARTHARLPLLAQTSSQDRRRNLRLRGAPVLGSARERGQTGRQAFH
jgi:hypothetical protein